MSTPTILQEAEEVTKGERQHHYGHPIDNHGCTAVMWNAYIKRRFPNGHVELTAHDICNLMILQKVSRDANLPKRDNDIDICGYARNKEQITEEEPRRQGFKVFGPDECQLVQPKTFPYNMGSAPRVPDELLARAVELVNEHKRNVGEDPIVIITGSDLEQFDGQNIMGIPIRSIGGVSPDLFAVG